MRRIATVLLRLADIRPVGVALVVMRWPATAMSDVTYAQRAEAPHLLAFIEHGGWVVDRNRARHANSEPWPRIKNQFDNFLDQIRSTEDLAVLAASRNELRRRSKVGSVWMVLWR